MKIISISVAIDLYDDYLDDTEVEIQIPDEMFDRLVSIQEEISEKGEDSFDEELENSACDIYNYINKAVDEEMPNYIDLQEDEELEDYSWCIQWEYFIVD